MKKYFVICAALVTALCSCTKNEVPSSARVDEGQKATLRIGVANDGTRAAINADNEAKVNDLQVFVFRGDALDAYGHIANASEISVSCTKGARNVWAVVNAPDLSSVTTLTGLKASSTFLGNNKLAGFVMTGSKDVTVAKDMGDVTINVNRVASRVVVRKITNKLSAPALQALTFKVDSIFVTNVQGKNSYDSTAFQTADGVWYNKMAFDGSLADSLKNLTVDVTAKTVAYNASESNAHALYVYPNDFTGDDVNAGTWSKRPTRLVLKVTIGTDGYYYPINLPVLESNKSYEISELTITRPGSDNPDTPVSSDDVKFKISVQPWTVVPLGESGSITI